MSHSVGALAELLHGTVFGPADVLIEQASAIEGASTAGITFVAEDRNLSRLKECRAAALIVNHRHVEKIAALNPARPLIAVEDPQAAFLQILPLFRNVRTRPKRGISPAAYISPSAKIGENCYVGPGAVLADDVVIGDDCDVHAGVHLGAGCRLGRDCVVYPNVVMYHDVTLGDRVIIHANAVLGADGFGYRFEQGRFIKIPQLGGVVIESDVEIGAGTTVDRGAVDATVIGAGTKIDNMVMIAHNCQIGRNNVFASQVGLAGSCSTGDYVRLGGQVGIKDHVHLGTGSMIGAKGGVHCDIPDGETWIGYPATPEADQKRLLFSLKRVPAMRDDVKELKAQVAELQAQLAALIAPLKAAG